MRPLIAPGPWLLSTPEPTLAAHRRTFGQPPLLDLAALEALASASAVLGRGGAGFPFAVKLKAVAARRALRRHVVVNLSEGEPASAKDAALVSVSPHLVLDGAAIAARALGAKEIDIVVPSELGWVEAAVRHAISERTGAGEDKRTRWRLHRAAPRFVSGEASAVTELIDGRENLPVTSWVPSAERGVSGRPTLLSNGETFAQIAAVALAGDRVPGTEAEPGTRLLSLTRGDRIEVHEVAHGTPWSQVLTPAELQRPVLLGGYHGQWAGSGTLDELTVSASALRELGLGIGAGVVIPLPAQNCPLVFTARLVHYLAAQSAGRCGPCINGLPALAGAFTDLVEGRPGESVDQLLDLVRGRGACAHPDGTARLVVSACTAFADEVVAHRHGSCTVSPVAHLRSA